VKGIGIANQGEIACRIIGAACELDLQSIAIRSDPDADSLHCEMADFAVRVGRAAASESHRTSMRFSRPTCSAGRDGPRRGEMATGCS